MAKLNGSAKWILVVVIVGGIVFSAGYAIKLNSANIRDLKEIKIKTRIVKLEANYKNIKESLNRIEEKLDK